MSRDGLGGSTKASSYSWEQAEEASWRKLNHDDDDENLHMPEAEYQRAQKQRQQPAKPSVHRGMIRYVVLVIDLSKAMKDNDMKPSRIEVALAVVRGFLRDFLDQNPLCNVALVGSRDARAEQLTELSGVASTHIEASRSGLIPSGEFSLQNSLELALNQLRPLPSYGSKEIIVVHGALATTDPSDIFSTIKSLKKHRVRCSIVSLASEVYAFKQCALITNGLYGVSLNKTHFKELLGAHNTPPALILDSVGTHFIRMGFPERRVDNYKSLCICHQEFKYEGYFCPRCRTKVCELPTECRLCGLNLVSSSHLARSYHHLFPVEPFNEVNYPSLQSSIDPDNAKKKSKNDKNNDFVQKQCFSCLKILNPNETIQLQCPDCLHLFCFDCDLFVHESLHNCPGCMC
eukprot:GSMAST32.ASY1.ANO1.536.1 assembled CDS